MARGAKFVADYVEHLPEIAVAEPATPGVSHIVVYHDDWCGMYKGSNCNCQPDVRRFVEPKRN